ncbi:hypothetical protein BIW11_07547 [Tropilaelaps mercedesae]|uniref:Uncharacterized protein n=1 Tax=Tropilaelaps mercedesae TaxID=418985 RepID=A0A1V9XTG1_9ACAR|nr:hypothetical protein BIW11_07547 [Tropilaelaps mercedesae]
MALKARLFTKDTRRASQDLTANLQYAISKVCRDKPVKLSLLKTDYDRFFKEKISTKSPETIAAALKSIEEHVIAVKVYMLLNNREMTDSLVGLRSAPYAADMRNEDCPQLSKERLLQIIREEAFNGVYVRELERRYISVFGNRPSYLPYKSIKELLHRTAEVELASSGKTLRVRIRQQSSSCQTAPAATPLRRPILSRIPSLNRNSMPSGVSLSTSLRARKPRDIMSISMFRPNERSFREIPCDMTRSVFIPSSSSSSGSSLTPSSDSGSPNGSIDMTMSMIMSSASDDVSRVEKSYKEAKPDMNKHQKDIMAAVLNGLPPEGLTLKGLIDELVTISGQALPLGVTPVDFLKKEFSDIVTIVDHPEGLRVYKTNSPLFPRRTLADVYTRIALHSNRKPSDRVLKVLKDIYKDRKVSTCIETTQPTDAPREASIVSVTPSSFTEPFMDNTTLPESTATSFKGHESKDDIVKSLENEVSFCGRSRLIPISKSQRPLGDVIADLKTRLAHSPVEYPREFEEIVEGTVADNQALLMELMSCLNLCLKPSGGRMVLTAN